MESQIKILGLDLSNSKVSLVLAELLPHGNSLEILDYKCFPVRGTEKNKIVDLDTYNQSLKDAVSTIIEKYNVQNVNVGISGIDIQSFNSSGVVAVKGTEVNYTDLNRVIETAKAVVLPSDREILHVVPARYSVDNLSGIVNPIGMCGVRLEGEVHIITGEISEHNRIIKSLESIGLNNCRMMYSGLATSYSLLSKEDKNKGTLLIDIGANFTNICFWLKGSLVLSNVLPIGGDHFTKDLSEYFAINFREAKVLKEKYGNSINNSTKESSVVNIEDKVFKLQEVNEVLNARAVEFFSIIEKVIASKRLKLIEKNQIVLTGGGSNLRGICTIAEFVLGHKAFKKKARLNVGNKSELLDENYVTSIGLIINEARRLREVNTHELRATKLINKFGDSIKNVFKEIF